LSPRHRRRGLHRHPSILLVAFSLRLAGVYVYTPTSVTLPAIKAIHSNLTIEGQEASTQAVCQLSKLVYLR
jgi:hypothetical protein